MANVYHYIDSYLKSHGPGSYPEVIYLSYDKFKNLIDLVYPNNTEKIYTCYYYHVEGVTVIRPARTLWHNRRVLI